jgi:hypothetical protein
MREKGVTITTIAESLNEDGIEISRQAVSDIVTRGLYLDVPTTKRSRAHMIVDRFCDLTHTPRLDAWPDLVHDDDDESNPTVIARINRARGLAAGDAASSTSTAAAR